MLQPHLLKPFSSDNGKNVEQVWHTYTQGHTRSTLLTRTKLQALVYDILPSTTAVFSYAIGSRKLSANEQVFLFVFCWCSNSSKCVTNNSNKTKRVIYSRQQSLHQHKYNHDRLKRDGTFILTRGGCVSCLRACLGDRLLPQTYQYPKLSEGADRGGGQLRGDKEYHFSGVTKSGRVWRTVPESDARSVNAHMCVCVFSSASVKSSLW